MSSYSEQRKVAPLTLDERRQRAWAYYRAVLRHREGRDYEEAEAQAWSLVQAELRELDREREAAASDRAKYAA